MNKVKRWLAYPFPAYFLIGIICIMLQIQFLVANQSTEFVMAGIFWEIIMLAITLAWLMDGFANYKKWRTAEQVKLSVKETIVNLFGHLFVILLGICIITVVFPISFITQ